MLSDENFQKFTESVAARIEQKTGQKPDLFVVTACARALLNTIEEARANGGVVGFVRTDPDTKETAFIALEGLFPGAAMNLGNIGQPEEKKVILSISNIEVQVQKFTLPNLSASEEL